MHFFCYVLFLNFFTPKRGKKTPVCRVVRVFWSTWVLAPLICYYTDRIQGLLGLGCIMWITSNIFSTRAEHTAVFDMERKVNQREDVNELLPGHEGFCEFEVHFHHPRVGFSHVLRPLVLACVYYCSHLSPLWSPDCRITVHATFDSLWSSATVKHSGPSV